MFFSMPWKECKKELAALYKRKHALESKSNGRFTPDSELDHLITEIDSLIEGDYASSVYSYYSKNQPNLIRERTGEVVSWKEAFGDSFDNISKSLRHSLVGLVEGGGRYKLK